MLGYIKTYFAVASVLLTSVGALNFVVDPLWYRRGNRLTGVNVPFNERLTKTNRLLNSDIAKYDCLIFGSSRLTLLDTKSLKKNNCFNYAFAAGTAEEFAEYAKFAKELGVNPQKVYVGIDAFNFKFTIDDKNMAFKEEVEVPEPQPMYQSYLFSIDSLKFSINTLIGRFPLERAYNQYFKGTVLELSYSYNPKFVTTKSQEKCDFSRVASYQKIRETFPNAKIIGYVAPISPWEKFNQSYAQGLLDCQLQGIHESSRHFNETYDFSYPSKVTKNTNYTYDGSHYYPYVHERIARILEGENSQFGIRVNQVSLQEYQELHRSKLKTFVEQQGKGHLW
jgi:hypothetical protein